MRNLICACCVVSFFGGCWADSAEEVIVYTALDAEFSRPIFQQFTDETGITVSPKFDTEATKTVGLTQALLAEKNRPRADVFWNNEILNTLRLEKAGLLDVYTSPLDKHYPETFRSEDGTWHGFAARARVLLVNRGLVQPEDFPDSIHDFTDPKWKGKLGIAKPLFGTTATHAACLFAVWGPEKAKQFFLEMKANEVQIFPGNKQVAQAVSAGKIAWGLADTDDAIIEVENGFPVEIVYADREADELGTLFIPNTLGILKGCPHPQAARKLVNYLLRPEVEIALARGPSAQIPLNQNVEVDVRVETPRTVKAMQVDFAKAVDFWDQTAEFITEEFTSAE